MQHTEGRFTGERDTTLYHQYWVPDDEPRALLLVAHGAGEHGARYADFARLCTARGYVVAAIDHVGHGRSGGTPGDLVDFTDYLKDLNQWRELLAARFPDDPIISEESGTTGTPGNGFVWCVDPRAQTILVMRPGLEPELIGMGGVLDLAPLVAVEIQHAAIFEDVTLK